MIIPRDETYTGRYLETLGCDCITTTAEHHCCGCLIACERRDGNWDFICNECGTVCFGSAGPIKETP